MKRLAAGILGLTLLALGSSSGPRVELGSMPLSVAAKLEGLARPFDSPLEAWSFGREKRLGPGENGGAGAPALYRRAERQQARMKRYSTALGRPAESSPVAKSGAVGTWESVGPGNIGGRTRVLVIHPERPRIMYAAGVSGGIWKTTNGGRSWRPVGDGLANLAVNSLVMDPADPSVLYAGTGEGYFREVVRETHLPLRGGGIFKSEDAGATWRMLEKTRGRKFHWVNDLFVSHHDPDRLYAATRKGVFRSLDGGRKWKKVLRPRKTRGGCLDLAARTDVAEDYLFASCGTLTQGTVYRHVAAEGGGKWESVLSESSQGRTSLAVAPSNQEVIYALASSTVPGPGGNYLQALDAVYRSDEGGAPGSWRATVRNDDPRKVNTILLSNPIVAFVEECGFGPANEFFSMGWYVNVIAVDPVDPERVWAGGVDLFRSDDGGRNWNPATYWWVDPSRSDFVHADQHGLVFHPTDPSVLYSLNDGGITRTTNAGQRLPTDDLAVCLPELSGIAWSSLNNNYGVTQFYHGSVFPDGETYLAGAQDNGTIRTRRGAGSFGFRVLGGDGGYSAVDPDNASILYATVQNGRVFKSNNGGTEFFDSVNGITDLEDNDSGDFTAVGENFLFISPLLLDSNDSQRLWSGGIRLWRTDDGGILWAAASTRLAGRASALAVAPGNSDMMLAGTEEGTVYRSTSAGAAGADTEWSGVRPRRGFVSSVAFDPSNPSVIYASYGDFGGEHVWRSLDAGLTWEAIDGEGADAVPNVPVHAVAVDPADGSRLYLGTDLGVLVSTDGGASWAAEITGFARVVTESLAFAETEDGSRRLFAFTHGRGVWRVDLE